MTEIVVALLGGGLLSTIGAIVVKRMDRPQAEQTRIDAQTKWLVDQVRTENSRLDMEVDELRAENKELRRRIAEQATRIDELERRLGA